MCGENFGFRWSWFRPEHTAELLTSGWQQEEPSCPYSTLGCFPSGLILSKNGSCSLSVCHTLGYALCYLS